MRKIHFLLFMVLICFTSCKEDVLPKPKGYLSLSYPTTTYQLLEIEKPYIFEISKNTRVVNQPNSWMQLKYPKLKATIDITYRPVQNNLKELIEESEKLVYKHAVKAEQIVPKDFLDNKKKVFGSLYDITGNAASQIQFHVTDSTHNFIKGSLYFYIKPNYDSVLPAVDYIKKDIIRLIETLEWKEQ